MNIRRLRDIRNFLLDMDGTLYLGPNLIDGAASLVAYLHESRRQYLFLTNNPTRDARLYSEKLRNLGIPAAPDEVLTAGEATVRFLWGETPFRRVYAVAPPSFEEELRRAGFTLCETDPEAVVLAFDTSLTYKKLERACLFVAAGLPYFATNPDKVCPTGYGAIPDCGAMAALIEAATSRTPRFIGKPSAAMARMAMSKLGAQPNTTAMAGDRLYTDMQMAYDTGITSVLVLSGETHAHDLNLADRRPDYVFPSVKELHQALAAADKA